MRARLATFLAVTFAFSWACGLAQYLMQPGLIGRMLFGAVFMFGPALGAVAAQRRAGERVLAPLGVTMSTINRWWAVAWLAPFAFVVATIFVSLVFPGVHLVLDGSGLAERMLEKVPPEAIAEARANITSIPPVALLLIMVAQALIAGISVNAVAAFGEELGWRGFAHVHLAHLGFWKRAFAVGAVWGIWHAPLIAQGHNYPEHPFVGLAMMTAFCTLLAPAMHFIRERSASVWAASVLHGTINASAGFAILLVKGGNDLVVGVTGLAGFIVLAFVNALIAYALRKEKLRAPV